MSGAELMLRRDPSPVFPEGAFMKTSIVYKIAEAHQPVETEVQRQLIKMEKLLKSYKKDMPQLHVACEKNGRGAEYSFSLNLWLPTGTLHAVGAAATARAGCKKAFGELERQLKKHQALLRKDYEWKRKRGRLREAEAS
jgi:ribosome-associated translation inhibitor RaiA